jgi:putative transcriptional regulator
MSSSSIVEAKRKLLKLTQEEIAADLKISRQYYNAIENFKREPSVELAKRIADKLELDWTIFFTSVVND